MKKLIIATIAAASLAAGHFAGATPFTISTSAPSYVVNPLALDTPAAVSFTGSAAVVTGSAANLYAAPYTGVGSSKKDTNPYYSAGTGSITFDFGTAENAFSLLWGSVDTFNFLSFYDGSTLIGTLTGVDILNPANGNQGIGGTVYAEIFSSLTFTKVVAYSTTPSFEFTDVSAYNTPDSGMTVALLGASFIGLALVRRKLAL